MSDHNRLINQEEAAQQPGTVEANPFAQDMQQQQQQQQFQQQQQQPQFQQQHEEEPKPQQEYQPQAQFNAQASCVLTLYVSLGRDPVPSHPQWSPPSGHYASTSPPPPPEQQHASLHHQGYQEQQQQQQVPHFQQQQQQQQQGFIAAQPTRFPQPSPFGRQSLTSHTSEVVWDSLSRHASRQALLATVEHAGSSAARGSQQKFHSLLGNSTIDEFIQGLLVPGERRVAGLDSMPYVKLYFQDATNLQVFEELVPGYLLLTNQRLILLSISPQTTNE
ncbi:hypothetical protein PTSG_05972 [Salpingoeca rosetta]|uniref:Uncharacterized protein n=1 Tax=Salpingoeca rosetta (strain ATCC 50818 / BSB-021) TaxID=946362 RepID=F2UDB4_SALR5|nr:uncharacterized protein PTSG_05972 [Salpingoeca rosetta]EGD74609.1 hypothetical protein PTSG_05972 [Salpingoeca rosetta]|eukprot:XP_004992866.1 hypothetical protein PTSG_05972 [Salpingoeca rosetta]